MAHSSIVDSRLWIRLDLDSSLKANSFFQTNPRNRAHFAAQLLLYDKIIIPTKDFGILPILVSWMGLRCLCDALDADAIGFARPFSLLGYAGNGLGISGFKIGDTPEKPFGWSQKATFGEIDCAPDMQLRHQCPFLSTKERDDLNRLVLSRSRQLEWDNELFMKNIVHESYTDIMSNPSLKDYILSQEPTGTEQVQLTSLSGVDPNQFRILDLERLRDGVDLVLRVAEINLEILMSSVYGDDSDLGTSVGAETLIKHKLIRSGALPELVNKFQGVLELENIPDVRPLVAQNEVSIPEIWKLRQKRKGRRFRKWLKQANPENARDLEKAYVSTLGRSSIYSSLPGRVIRFVVTTAVGAVAPLIGTVAGVTDSFFLEKWLGGYSPRLFLEDVRGLPTKK